MRQVSLNEGITIVLSVSVLLLLHFPGRISYDPARLLSFTFPGAEVFCTEAKQSTWSDFTVHFMGKDQGKPYLSINLGKTFMSFIFIGAVDRIEIMVWANPRKYDPTSG